MCEIPVVSRSPDKLAADQAQEDGLQHVFGILGVAEGDKMHLREFLRQFKKALDALSPVLVQLRRAGSGSPVLPRACR